VSLEDLSRLALAIVHAIIIVLGVMHYRKSQSARGYTAPVIALAFVNFAFYAMAYARRVGGFIPPTPDFFSTLSNVRSWGMALAVLVILAVEVRDVWTGDR
jgi:hypothetical protein